MPGEKVEIVEESWRAINRGDVDALLDFMTDDVDLRPPSHMLDGITFRGHAGVRAWMKRQTESWSKLEGSPHEMASGAEPADARLAPGRILIPPGVAPPRRAALDDLRHGIPPDGIWARPI